MWDLRNGIFLSTCPGSLVGAASTGETLITMTPAGVKAWEARTGWEREPHTLDPSTYCYHQRFVANANRFKLVVELRDALEIEPPRLVRIEHDPRYYPSLETWALTPDDLSLVATLTGEVAGQDWASGLCVDLSSGARRFKFKVNKFQSGPPLNFSREHGLLLISDDIYHLSLFDLETGRAVREVWVSGFTNVAAAMLDNPWLVAVNVWEPVRQFGHFALLGADPQPGAHVGGRTCSAPRWRPCSTSRRRWWTCSARRMACTWPACSPTAPSTGGTWPPGRLETLLSRRRL